MIATDIKTKIPEGWNQIQFGQLFVERKKSRLKVEEAFLGGQYPFFTSGEKVLSRNDYLSDGSHLFLATGGVANAKFFNGKASYSSDTYCIAGKDENTKLLFYTIWNNLSYINYHFFEGSGLKHLQKSDFKKFKILFPENPKEQQKIAEVLTTIDEAIEKTDAIIEKNKRIKQGLMQDLFRYGIDEHGNIRSEKTHKFKTVNIGRDEIRIPEEWEVKTLLDAIGGNNEQIVAGPFGSNLKVSDYIDSGVPILRLQNINANKFIDKDIKYLSPFKANLLKYHSFVGGDIALAKLGDPVGETCIIPKKFTFGIVVADVVRIRVNKKYSDEKYITYILNSDYARLQLYLNVSGTTRPRVNLSHIRNMKFVFPKAEEQIRIASMLNLIDKNIDEDEIYKQKYLSLKRGLMEDLLTGKVRVNRLITN